MNGEAPLRLKLVGVSKSFPGVLANDNVSFASSRAKSTRCWAKTAPGKSTLVKMIYGIIAPDKGGSVRRRADAHLQSARRARLGIGMVFQHFSLFEAMTVLENIALGIDAKISSARTRSQNPAVLDAYGLKLDPRRVVSTLERRRAAAHRDRARAAAQSQAPDHGRADLGADAAGSRPIVRGAARLAAAAARSSTFRTSCMRSRRSATPRRSYVAAGSSRIDRRSRPRGQWPRR